ncbi:molybdenum cofactor biosynthesis protein MoaC /molybdenum cofactor biosynthesis protein MoaB [Nonlabens ulvanivorans]|uniref:Molybdenum cofactor biosynthesis protein MoaC /molybdenum cofactor biosynthesis protein MoaB n=1 Tax=Nonlabens ulvanivorans TaxID=906888 RepID=A0A090WC31_NONUL|nr:bifunctional molybdenum cofactor biosynthesis protein MoaC/MoaB [Nonlabens ulvanivorans]GAL74560.1 molybdenum cofactor biosynthesis protein MoaC /molybdenum cofactor biosynthesis protein MoaB [Nonlabens ulvanivorans]
MVDITHKSSTLRIAVAQATVKVSTKQTIEAILNDAVPKGNVLAMSKAAGLLGVKKTPDLLPDCHPLPIEYTGIEYEFKNLDIIITMTVKTIYKTGVEVEAMHGASVVALNMYDMLKPIDKGIEIHNIKLLSKKGGKSGFKKPDTSTISAGIIVCSDSLSKGQGKDGSGTLIEEKLNSFNISYSKTRIVPDEVLAIQNEMKSLLLKHNLIIISGGTGLSHRDVTPEAVLPLLDKRMSGAEETIRRYGQERTPFAMLSRSVVGGTIGNALVIALPGAPKGVLESLDSVLPYLFHTFSMLKGQKH